MFRIKSLSEVQNFFRVHRLRKNVKFLIGQRHIRFITDFFLCLDRTWL